MSTDIKEGNKWWKLNWPWTVAELLAAPIPVKEESIENRGGAIGTYNEEQKLKKGHNCWRRFHWPWPVVVLVVSAGPMNGCEMGHQVLKPLFIKEEMRLDERKALLVMHSLEGVKMIGGVCAALLADSYFGKFKVLVISYLFSCAVSLPLYSLASTGYVPLEKRQLMYFAGIICDNVFKFWPPTLQPFLSEQFRMPEQELQLQTFYVYDYVYLNLTAGFLASTIVEFVYARGCMGSTKCYPILFYSWNLCTAVYLFILIVMSKRYRIALPKRCIIKDALKCIFRALKVKYSRESSGKKQKHFLDWAEDRFDETFRNDLRQVGHVGKVISIFFIYAFIYYQMDTKFIYQASYLDGSFGSLWTMKPSHTEVLNPFIVIIVAPILDNLVFPLLSKYSLLKTPLRKLGVSYMIGICAFIMAGFLQLRIEQSQSIPTSPDMAQLRIINALNQPAHLSSSLLGSSLIEPDSVYEQLKIKLDSNTQSTTLQLYDPSENKTRWVGDISLERGEAKMFLLKEGPDLVMLAGAPTVQKSNSMRPQIVLFNGCDSCIGAFDLVASSPSTTFNEELPQFGHSVSFDVPVSIYKLYFKNKVLRTNLHFKDGGMYALVLVKKRTNDLVYDITLYKPNRIHIVWIFPQIILLSITEVIQYVAASIFIYTQSPPEMRAVVKMFQVVTVSLAEVSIGVMSLIPISDSVWFFASALLLFLGTVLHICVSLRYEYQNSRD